MTYPDIPISARDAGSPITPQLLQAYWSRDLWLDHARQALEDHLSPTVGHSHDAARQTTYIYNYITFVETFAGVSPRRNNAVDFEFGGGSFPLHTYAGFIVPAIGPAARPIGTVTGLGQSFAAHLQAVMRGAVLDEYPSFGTPQIYVTFVDPSDPANVEDPNKGMLRIRNAESSDTPNKRILSMLLATGDNEQWAFGPSVGFGKYDLRGGLTYHSESGTLHGYEQDKFILGDGGQVDTDGLVDECATEDKYGTGVVLNSHMTAGAITNGKVINKAITGAKLGARVTGGPSTLQPNGTPGDSGIYTVDMDEQRRPMVSVTPVGAQAYTIFMELGPPSYGGIVGGKHRYFFTLTNYAAEAVTFKYVAI